MPLSDHEQRMLDQIESALYAEDPKFASSVRGGTLRAPSARRRLQGAALFVIGLAMLVCRCRVQGHHDRQLPDSVSVIGFIVMFGGVVFAITGPRVAGGRDRAGSEPGRPRARSAPRAPADRSPAGWRTGSAAASTSRRRTEPRGSPQRATPFLCASVSRISPHTAPLTPRRAPPLDLRALSLTVCACRGSLVGPEDAWRGDSVGTYGRNSCHQMEQSGGLWGKVADNGATGAPEW